jgi:hypothetical protein
MTRQDFALGERQWLRFSATTGKGNIFSPSSAIAFKSGTYFLDWTLFTLCVFSLRQTFSYKQHAVDAIAGVM